jgi:hypothetical protein
VRATFRVLYNCVHSGTAAAGERVPTWREYPARGTLSNWHPARRSPRATFLAPLPASADNLDNPWFQTLVDFIKSCTLDSILGRKGRWIILRQVAWSGLIARIRGQMSTRV